MAWLKKPYKTAEGRRVPVGYKDHEGIERTRGGFTSRKLAADWASAVDEATQQGPEALKAFLDRTVRGIIERDLTLQELYALFFVNYANPDRDNGLARGTWDSYKTHWEAHICPLVGHFSAEDFARPGACSKLLQELEDAGAGAATRKRVRAVLSSMLSWGVEQEHISANGFSLIRIRRRRSNRQGAVKSREGEPRRSPRSERQGRALSPRAVAAIHRAQLTDITAPAHRALRDATATLVQYLLGCRNQELWGLRWEEFGPRTTSFAEVVSYGALDEPKTSGSRRTIPTPALLWEILSAYREALTAAGYPPAPDDFVFAGEHSDGHMTADQARLWPRRYFKPACQVLAGKVVTVKRQPRRKKGETEKPQAVVLPRYDLEDVPAGDFRYLDRSTQYALRRGHMSVRLRAGEDSVLIAKQCGTSVQMLHRHYADDIAEGGTDLRPLEEQLREALGWKTGVQQPRLRAV
jgi:integrase